MRSILPFRTLLLAVGLGSALSAHATLITFENLPGGTAEFNNSGLQVALDYASPLTTQGFKFDEGSQFATWVPISTTNTDYSNYTGSTTLFSNHGNVTTVSQAGGGAFSLTSLDLANVNRVGHSVASNVNFTGVLLDGGTVTQSYAIPSDDALHTVTFAGFTNLASFTLSSPNNAYQFDNVNVQTVPEPATCVLLSLGGVAALRRRRG